MARQNTTSSKIVKFGVLNVQRCKSNTRIHLFDLFNYDIINKTTFTFNILNELNHVYYLKNSKIHKDKDLINIYLRYGDLRKNKINEKKPVSNNFELNMLENYLVN